MRNAWNKAIECFSDSPDDHKALPHFDKWIEENY